MAAEQEELKREIEERRAVLGAHIDEIEDRISPTKVAGRARDDVVDKIKHTKESIMSKGSEAVDSVRHHAHDVKDKASGAVSSTLETAGERAGSAKERATSALEAGASTTRDTPGALGRFARSNPLAAGALAIGAGALLAALVPTSARESELGRAAADRSSGVTDRLKEAGAEVGSTARDAAREEFTSAGDSLKEEASESLSTVKHDARGAADEVRNQAQSGVREVQESRA